MNQQIYGISFTNVNDSGNYLVFGNDGNLKSKDLTDLQIQMLQSNPIPRLLSLSMEELDQSVQIRFNITSLRKLSQAIPAASLRLADYYELLLQIATILDDSKTYMLVENNYVLQEDFIYIGAKLSEISLCYLPIKHLPTKKSAAEEFRELATNLFGKVKEVRGDGFQTLLNFCKSETFSFGEMKALLKKIHQSATAQGETVQAQQPKSHSESTFDAKDEAVAAKEPWKDQVQSLNKSAQPAHPQSADSRKIKDTPRDIQVVEQMPLKSKERTYLILFLLLINALIWKQYLDHSNESKMLISLGLTVLTLDAAYIYWKFKHQLFNNLKPSGRAQEIEPRNIQYGSRAGSVQGVSEQKPELSDESYYQSLESQTTLLDFKTSEPTVLLDPSETIGVQPIPPYLEVLQGEQVEKQYIQSRNYIIGRGGPSVNLVEDVIGVSRMHLEIFQEIDGWYAKDLDSKNGSFLNHDQMQANQPYLLKDGDVIKIVKTEFVFRTR